MTEVICYSCQPVLVNFAYSGVPLRDGLAQPRNMRRKPYNVQRHDDALLIRRVRMQAGFTIETLAERIGMSPQHLQRMETGERNISLEWLKKIAAALDVPLARLIPGGDGLSEDEREMLEWLRNHPSDQRVIQSTLRGLQEARKEFEHDN